MDIRSYAKLKTRWGLGHNKWRIQKCSLYHECPGRTVPDYLPVPGRHVFVIGLYMDRENQLQQEHLG